MGMNSTAKKILLVEDDALIAMAESMLLENHGYAIVTAFNAVEAIGAVKENDIDLVLMDIDLGLDKMDGTEAARIILEDHDIPIVFLSSHTEPEVVEKTEKITSYGYVVKNSGDTVLLTSIKMALRLFDAKQKIEEKEEKYQKLFENMNEEVHLWKVIRDDDGNIINWQLVDVNRSGFIAWDRPRDELIGRTPEEIWPESDTTAHFMPIVKRIFEERKPYAWESYFSATNQLLRMTSVAFGDYFFSTGIDCKDQRNFSSTLEMKNVQQLDGVTGWTVPDRFYCRSEDLTDWEDQEEKIRFQAELLDSVEQSVITTDVEGRITFWNNFAEQLYGWKKAEVLGRQIIEVIVPEQSQQQAQEIMDKLSKGEKWSGEFNVHRKDGTRFLAQVSDYPVLNDEKKLAGIIGISMDITEDNMLQVREQKLLHNLAERIRELNCLYAIAKLINQPDLTVERLMDEVIRILPLSLEYPDATCSRITINGKSRQSKNFVESEWNLRKEIIVDGDELGSLEVGYLRKILLKEDGPFLKEEKDLLSGVVNHLQTFLIRERQKKESRILEKASIAVLRYADFNISARKIFDYAKEITGAISGYVALLSDDGNENELLFLDDGGLVCNVNPDLPMPIRGLRAEAYNTGKAVMDNDFMNSEWAKFMPGGHCVLKNVLFAPLSIEGRVVGIIGLANKENDFNSSDLRISELLGSIAAMSLMNSKAKKQIEDALAEKDLLMREMNHRIKNNLAMVSSLISLKEKDLNGAADLSDLEHRIDSIRLVHEYLYKSERLNFISIREYLSRIVSGIFDLNREKIKVEINCDSSQLHSKRAAALGLIVNELLLNAVKYCGIDHRDLEISISARKDIVNGLFTLTFSDNGTPIPDEISMDSPGTFGLRLISNLVNQLDGTVNLQKVPNPVFTIIFPADGA